MPLRSLKRSSGCGARTSGVRPQSGVTALAGATEFVGATEVAGATGVRDAGLPHNSCTPGEIGCERSPAWNSERKIGSFCCSDAVFNTGCVAAVTGVTLRESGKLER